MIKAIIFDCFGVLTSLDATTPNEELFTYIRDSLKPTYRIGMLSNVNSNKLDQLFTDEQVGLFDGIALSYEIGAAKPDNEAYEAAAMKLGMEPSECVFIDDIEEYVLAASKIGMQGMWHQNTADTIAKIQELLDA